MKGSEGVNGVRDFLNFVRQLSGGVHRKKDSEGNDIEVRFSLRQPATSVELGAAEEELGRRLPASFRRFLLECGGGSVYDYGGLDGFEILGVRDIPRVTRAVQQMFGDDWPDGLLVFARYIGEGNYLALAPQAGDSDECEVVDCFTQESPDSWETIAGSFDEFLAELLIADGRKYWLV